MSGDSPKSVSIISVSVVSAVGGVSIITVSVSRFSISFSFSRSLA